MSLCLNDRRNWLRAAPRLDLSSEIDLIDSWQARWVTFSLPLRRGLYPGAPNPRQRRRAKFKWEM